MSISGLRRLAPIYESVYGRLLRTGKGGSDNPRLWSSEAVNRLAAARRLVEVGRYHAVKNALEALRDGDVPESAPNNLEAILETTELTDRAVLELLVSEVKALRLEVLELKQNRLLTQPFENKILENVGEDKQSLVVRLAVRVDNWLKRFR